MERDNRLPLRDLMILEIAEGIAGPVCGLQLADLGATVVKVEPPHGDRAREWGPPMAGEDAAVFVHLNRGKKSVTLDLEDEAGGVELERLLRRADAAVVHMDPPERDACGIDWEEIVDRFPHLVLVEITELGVEGPLADRSGSELVCQAMTGFPRYVGEPGGDPCRVGYEIASVGAGMHACQAVLAGVRWRDESGEGQLVRVPVVGQLLSLKTILLAANSNPDAWNGFHLHGPHWQPDVGWITGDGQITFDFRHGQREGWAEFCRRVGLDHLLDDPDYEDWRSTIAIGDRKDDLGEVYRPIFAQMTSKEASDLVNELGGISMKFHDYGEVLDHPQVQMLDSLVEVPNAAPGAQQQIGSPFRFSAFELPKTYAPAPGLGEHTRDVLPADDQAS